MKALSKGIGDVTVGIFLRELRGLWPKAQPRISGLVLAAARELRFVPPGRVERDDALRRLERLWMREGNRLDHFPDFEAALVRYALAHRRKPPKNLAVRENSCIEQKRVRGNGDATSSNRRFCE